MRTAFPRSRWTISMPSPTSSLVSQKTTTWWWPCPRGHLAVFTRRSLSGYVGPALSRPEPPERRFHVGYNTPLTMGFADDANALIQEKNFDGVESLGMNQLESDPADVDAFLRPAKALRKAEQRSQ